MPITSPDDMVGCTVLTVPLKDGQRYQGRIMQPVDYNKTLDENNSIGVYVDVIGNGESNRICIANIIDTHQQHLQEDLARIKFLCSFNTDEYEGIITYTEIMNHIEHDNDDLQVWKSEE